MQEFLALGVPLARFARTRDLHYNQWSRWRKEYLAGKCGPVNMLGAPESVSARRTLQLPTNIIEMQKVLNYLL